MKSMAEFLKAYSQALTKHQPGGSPQRPWRMPVVVSRQVGSGGLLFAQALADRLGFEVCDKKILEEISRRSKVPEDLVRLLDERPGRSLEVFGASLLRGASLSVNDYDAILKGTLRALLQLGNVVIIGRGANFLAEPGKALRVRLVAPLKVRIANIMQRCGVDEKTARQMVHDTDAERAKFMKRVYGQEESAPDSFDLGLNTHKIPIEQAVRIALDVYEFLARSASPPDSGSGQVTP
jgi:cytidylate kinase